MYAVRCRELVRCTLKLVRATAPVGTFKDTTNRFLPFVLSDKLQGETKEILDRSAAWWCWLLMRDPSALHASSPAVAGRMGPSPWIAWSCNQFKRGSLGPRASRISFAEAAVHREISEFSSGQGQHALA